jgi:N utilization substance protein A
MINNIKNLIEQLCFDNGLTEEFVLSVLDNAIKEGWALDEGVEYNIVSQINKNKFDNTFHTYKHLEVVKEVSFPQREISVANAQSINKNYKIGDIVKEEINLSKLSRTAITHVDNYIKEHIQLQTKKNEFEFFSSKVGSLVICTVVAISSQGLGIIVNINNFEGLITDHHSYHFMKSEYIPGMRLKAYIYKVEENPEGFQVFLSRNSEEFLLEIMKDEIPEIRNNLIKVINIARAPGFASIVMVKNEDPQQKLNEVGACIGSGGHRIKNIQKELKNEKIYLLPWKDVLFTRIAMAISYRGKVPIHKLIVHEEEEENYIEVVVPQEYVSKIIGPRGRNIDLICKILNEKIKITSIEDMDKKEMDENMLEEENVDEIIETLGLKEEEVILLKNMNLLSFKALNMPFQDFLNIPFPHKNHSIIYNKLLDYIHDINNKNNNESNNSEE